MDFEYGGKCCQVLSFFPEKLTMEENPLFLRKFDYFANFLQTFYPSFPERKIIRMMLFDEVSLETSLLRRGLPFLEEIQTSIDYIIDPSGTNLIGYSREIGKKREEIQEIFQDIKSFILKSPNDQYRQNQHQSCFFGIFENLRNNPEMFSEKHEKVPISKNLQNVAAFYLKNRNLCNCINSDSKIARECFEPIRNNFSSEQILATIIPNDYSYMEEEGDIFEPLIY